MKLPLKVPAVYFINLKMRLKRVFAFLCILLTPTLLVWYMMNLRDAEHSHRNISLIDNGLDGKDTVRKDRNNKVLADHYVLMQDPQGRLGNWMFEYAFAYSAAKIMNYKCIIRSNHPLTKVFDIPNVSDMKLKNLIFVRESNWYENRTWHEYSDYLSDVSHNITFKGYFVRYPYFINNSKEIKEIYKVKPAFIKEAQTFIDANTPKKKTLIGIHVRRGDFLTPKHISRGKVVADQEYFIKAMSYYRRLYSDAFFIVVSNDKPWCQQNIVGPDVRYSSFTKAALDFAIMTLSDHTIISSGTFSWWSGWLAGGTVVYLADYPNLVGTSTLVRPESYYFPEWIPMVNGNRT